MYAYQITIMKILLLTLIFVALGIQENFADLSPSELCWMMDGSKCNSDKDCGEHGYCNPNR